MLILSINKDEEASINKNLESYRLTSATERRVLISSSPVSNSTNNLSNNYDREHNFIKPSTISHEILCQKLEDVIKDAEEKEKKYEALCDKISKFGI